MPTFAVAASAQPSVPYPAALASTRPPFSTLIGDARRNCADAIPAFTTSAAKSAFASVVVRCAGGGSWSSTSSPDPSSTALAPATDSR